MNKLFSKIKAISGITWILIAAAFVLGFWLSGSPDKKNQITETVKTTADVKWWTCAMHPSVKLPQPGQCPICFMDLIPLATSSGEIAMNQLMLSPEAEMLAEIETSPVIRGKAAMTIKLSGKVEYDETKLGNITAWVPGRLERMFVDYTGIKVNKGEHLVELYSPDLYSAQEELIQALKLVESAGGESTLLKQTGQTTLTAAREKLRLMGLLDEQISQIKRDRNPSSIMTIYSPMTGVVIEKNGVEGAYVNKGSKIYTIANLDRVWVVLDAYEQDLPWLIFGQKVTFYSEAFPGEAFSGTIAFINPILDAKTRTIKVRINALNTAGLLKPGMFVHGEIQAVIDKNGKAVNPALSGKWICPMHPEVVRDQSGQCDVCGMDLVKAESLGIVNAKSNALESLLIPASAVLKTGDRSVVYVRHSGDEPLFEGREIVLGQRVGDQYVVKSGVALGEQVVVKGNFKIDSAMQISAKPSMMNPEGGKSVVEHDHGEMSLKKETETMDKLPNSESFSKALKLIGDAYFEIQSALAKDDFKRSKTAMFALNIVITASAEKDFDLSENVKRKWLEIQQSISHTTEHAQHWSGIDEARKAFETLSKTIIEMEQDFGHFGDGNYYEFFCPMAFDNQGASWLSREKDVFNPYFGAKMLKCGEVKKVWKSVWSAPTESVQN